ncbi:hypothetical protein GOV10_05040 [Candidatus Woesearchaeota archaeon]|nr:hypothetical protein [Candidatus Woesearchaeota archaeon]
MYVKLRAHHVARLIEFQDDLGDLVRAMAIAQYDKDTVDYVKKLFFDLYESPESVVEILSDGEAKNDDVCRKCVFSFNKDCFLDYGASEQGMRLDDDARKKYSLTKRIYSVEELLWKRVSK